MVHVISSFLLIILTLSKTNGKMIHFTDDNARRDHLIESAIEIANVNFNYRKHTVVLYKDVDDSIPNRFLHFYQGTVIVQIKRDGLSPRQLVIIVDSYFSFMKIFSKLKPDLKGQTLLHSGVKILIVLFSKPYRLYRINRILWSYHATDVLIMIADKSNRISLYTYFPYKNHLDCHNEEPTLIGYWNETVGLESEMYPDKMRNMQGCPLYISTDKLYHPLTEQKIPLQIIKRTIVRLLRDVMHFTPIISSKDYISIDFDHPQNWSECLNEVITSTSNISTCSISFGFERISLLDYSTPYFRLSLAWLAPPTKPGPMWWRLLSPLNGYLWLVLLLVVSFVKSLPFTMKLRRVKKFCRQHFKNIDKLHSVAFRSWGILMGQPIRVAPRRFRDIYILGLWIWFTFVVRNAYQSVLIGALKYDAIVGDFYDLKETVDEGYSFGGGAGTLTHFEHDPLIRERFEIIPESKFEEVFHDVLNGNRKFVIATSLEYAWAYCLSQGMSENKCGHVLPNSIMTVPLVVWMKKNSPFARPLSEWLPRLIESGLLIRKTIKIMPDNFKTIEPTPLTSNQIVSCMLCLLLGYTISALVFVVEKLRYKSTREKKCRLSTVSK